MSNAFINISQQLITTGRPLMSVYSMCDGDFVLTQLLMFFKDKQYYPTGSGFVDRRTDVAGITDAAMALPYALKGTEFKAGTTYVTDLLIEEQEADYLLTLYEHGAALMCEYTTPSLPRNKHTAIICAPAT